MRNQESIINVMAVDNATDSSSFYSLAAYATLAFGYILTVAFTHNLTLLQFGAATLVNGAWGVVFYLLSRTTCRQLPIIHLSLLFILAVVSQSLTFLGLEYNWLLVAVTVGVIATTVTPLIAAFIAVAMLTTSAVIFTILYNGHLSAVAANVIQVASALVFVYAFSVISHKYEVERQRSNDLIISLGEAQQQLRAYANEVEDLAVIRERNRMAREIHDTLGHYLTILALKLETATKLSERGDPSLHDELIDARRFAGECLSEVRHSVAALRPSDTTSLSLASAIKRLVTEFETTCPTTEVIVDYEYTIPEDTLDADQRVTLYRTVQEGLTNIRKHAQASKVLLRLRIDAVKTELTILDNGIGKVSRADGHAVGYGLLGLQERVALLNGTATSAAQPDTGWRVHIVLPHVVVQEKVPTIR